MSQTKRAVLQIARAVLALLAVLWTLSLAQVVTRVLSEPGFFTNNWMRIVISIGVTLLPAWGYLKLTEVVKRPQAAGGSSP